MLKKERYTKELIVLGMLSAATLIFETSLTRFLAVAQFYHFSFLVVSLALLGFGASGAVLSVFPGLKEYSLSRLLAVLSFCFAASLLVSYAVVNFLPFDSYSIAWDSRQVIYFVLYYLCLSLPFLISGLGIGAALSQVGQSHFLFYGANLLGSALGTGIALISLSYTGVLGTVLLSVFLSVFGGLLILEGRIKTPLILIARWIVIGLFLVTFSFLRVKNIQWRAPLGIITSPYKGLTQVLRHPKASNPAGRWNAFSRVDLVVNAEIHTLPGLSYTYPGVIPDQLGLSVDAGPPHPITLSSPENFQPADWMPEGIVFLLEPNRDVLVVHPAGGLGVLQSLAGNSQSVTVLEENPLLPQAVDFAGSFNIYNHPRVEVRSGPTRSELKQMAHQYQLVFLPLTDAYQPVSSGAFSLQEDYLKTVEGMSSLLQATTEDGILMITRWIQHPPSEGLRLINTLIEALLTNETEQPATKLVIFRGVQTITVLVRPAGWSPESLAELRSLLEERRFDLVWAPDITKDEVNQFNQLPQPVFFEAAERMVDSHKRTSFIREYPFDIKAPTDNHPFFFHFFTWQQTPEVLRTIGRTWQPFGGSGYFVLLALLGLVLLLSGGMILLPLLLSKHRILHMKTHLKAQILSYFGLIGFGFMFFEIPLIQRWILLLGHPEYAFTVVVGTLLLFSGLGSALSGKGTLTKNPRWLFLLPLGFSFPLLLWFGGDVVLGWPAWSRWLVGIVSIAPLGFLMGIPFPLGLSWLKKKEHRLGPLAWAVNGCASVTASVLATLAALSFGYGVVLLTGSLMYFAAGLIYFKLPH